MSTKWIGIYGGFFLLMLAVALLVSGVLQHGILPRLWGPGTGETEKTEPAEGGGREAAPAKETPAAEVKPPEPAPLNDRTGGSATAASSAGARDSEPPPKGEVQQTSERAPGRVSASGGPGREGPGDASVKEGGADKSEQVKRLARVSEGMRAKEAASVIEKLERPLGARVLSEIKDRQAAKILGAMNPATAAELIRLLSQSPS